MRRTAMLCAVLGLAVIGLVAASPAHAAFRVIKWDITKVCQIYDFGIGNRPIFSDYRVLTRPLPTFDAALRAKDRLWRQGHCSI